MATVSPSATTPAVSGSILEGAKARGAGATDGLATDFLRMLDGVTVADPVQHRFEGSVSRDHILWFWQWISRDVIADIGDRIDTLVAAGAAPQTVMEQFLPEIMAATKGMLNAASHDPEADRRLTVQIGGEDVRESLPVLTNALRCRPLIAKAKAFGKRINKTPDDKALCNALRSMPVKEPEVFALLMHALVGQVAHPSRLVTAVTMLSDGASEDYIRAAGYGPMVEALLAHAQEQHAIAAAHAAGFADMDLVCRAVERFHRLMRAVTAYVEMNRSGRWAGISADLTRRMSRLLEPLMRDVGADVSQALRKPREGADRIDADRLLAALNGLYLMSAVRDARDSLAVNALFDKIWSELSQTLEVLLKRNLEDYRRQPVDGPAAERLEAGIKMAEIRFNTEYADILRRARDAARHRTA